MIIKFLKGYPKPVHSGQTSGEEDGRAGDGGDIFHLHHLL